MLLTAVAEKLKLKEVKDEHQLEVCCWNEGDDDVLLLMKKLKMTERKLKLRNFGWEHDFTSRLLQQSHSSFTDLRFVVSGLNRLKSGESLSYGRGGVHGSNETSLTTNSLGFEGKSSFRSGRGG